ncbi:MAG: helix-turn-helix transcriptional regulator [Bacteroidales bacterium]|nr:helix-turn-helix transcriptional regulator [Bacteroidales bacterium]
MKSKIDIQFGARIAELRKQLNISQEELAERCGVHRTYIGSIERGEKSPTLNTIEKFARGLNVSLLELFSFTLSESNSNSIDERE